jgi:hypothetical protein
MMIVALATGVITLKEIEEADGGAAVCDRPEPASLTVLLPLRQSGWSLEADQVHSLVTTNREIEDHATILRWRPGLRAMNEVEENNSSVGLNLKNKD